VYFDDEGEYRNLIQTDAAIYHGNSGGPLINLAGQIVGIDALIANSRQGVEAQALSFAIPSNLAAPIVHQVIAGQTLIRPWLGVRHVPVDADVVKRENLSVDEGALIARRVGDTGTVRPAVSPGGPAAKAGMREGDVITFLDGHPVDSDHPLDNVLADFAAGTRVTVTAVRGTQKVSFKVTLGRREEQPVGC